MNSDKAFALKKIDTSIRSAFSKIKEEIDIHLDSINGNTNEINANFEHIAKLEQKVDKLSERFDEIQIMLSTLVGHKPSLDKAEFEGISLNIREQEVFLILYTEKGDVTYEKIARKLGLTPMLVERYIKILIAKKIPIITRFVDGKVLLDLDKEFRDLQTKENVLRISEDISAAII